MCNCAEKDIWVTWNQSPLHYVWTYSWDLFGPLFCSAHSDSAPTIQGVPFLLFGLPIAASFSLTHSLLSLEHSSLCEAPMVTCGPRKQDKLSTHNSQQCACPLSLAHHARQQKTPPEAPTTSPFKCQPPRLKSQTAM